MFEKHRAEIVRHAEEVFPEECLGIIHNDKYVRLKNVDLDPEKHFAMSNADMDRYLEDPLLEAIVHSHPDGPIHPSCGDMRAQIDVGIPYVIAAHHPMTGWVHLELGDHLLDWELEGRPFCHGIFDCFALLRSWWWQKQNRLFPDFVRQDRWWEKGENLYVDHFRQYGFVEMKGLSLSEAKAGDIFTFKLDFKTEQHALVYNGDGRVYHHMPGQLSTVTAAEVWANRAARWLRHESMIEA